LWERLDGGAHRRTRFPVIVIVIVLFLVVDVVVVLGIGALIWIGVVVMSSSVALRFGG